MRKLQNLEQKGSKKQESNNQLDNNILRAERLKAFKEKYKSLKNKEVVQEDSLDEEEKEEVREITEQEVRVYNFIYKTAKNLFRVVKSSHIPLLLFLILDLFCLSRIDFDNTKEEDQKKEYDKTYKTLISSFIGLSKKEDLTNEDIILELL